MRVLITGGGGFIGHHLVESQLAQGHFVRVADIDVTRLDGRMDDARLDVMRADIRDPRAVWHMMQGMDIVYHLACAHLDVSLPAAVYHQVNVDATALLLHAATAAGVRRFVHCSTVGVFGRLRVPPPADESSRCTPTHVYEASKLRGERVALEHGEARGLPVVVARPAWVYGPGCPRTRKLLRTAATGTFVMFGSGRTWRQPIYVADAVRGLEQCARAAGAEGEVYILAGREAVTIEQLVRLAAEAQSVTLAVPHLPALLGHCAGWALQCAFKPLRRSPPFSARSMDFFLKDNLYDTAKAVRGLGFDAITDLRQGFAQTVDLLANGHRIVAAKERDSSACASA